jgi:hypothetical protein
MPHDIHDINTPFYGIISMTASLYSLSFQLSGITPITPFSNTLGMSLLKNVNPYEIRIYNHPRNPITSSKVLV